MTKKLLLEKLNEMASDVEDAIQATKTLQACLKDLQSKLEDLPGDESEVED